MGILVRNRITVCILSVALLLAPRPAAAGGFWGVVGLLGQLGDGEGYTKRQQRHDQRCIAGMVLLVAGGTAAYFGYNYYVNKKDEAEFKQLMTSAWPQGFGLTDEEAKKLFEKLKKEEMDFSAFVRCLRRLLTEAPDYARRELMRPEENKASYNRASTLLIQIALVLKPNKISQSDPEGVFGTWLEFRRAELKPAR